MGPLEFCKYAILFECHHSKRCIDKKCRSTISHFASAKWHIRRIRLWRMHLPFASAKWQSLWRMHRIRQSVVIPSGIMLNVVVTSVVAPSVVMLNVVVPFAILLQRNGKATVPLAHWFELGDFLLNIKKKSRRVQTTRLKRRSKIMSLLAAMSRIIKISRVWVK